MLIAEVQELFAGELSAVVSDDDVGNPKPVDDVGEEKDGLFGADVGEGSSLDPLGELAIATSKWVYPPFAFCRGPTKLSPHTANGHVMGIM